MIRNSHIVTYVDRAVAIGVTLSIGFHLDDAGHVRSIIGQGAGIGQYDIDQSHAILAIGHITSNVQMHHKQVTLIADERG